MKTSEKSVDTTTDPSKHGTEYLANERTFLAWVRTCIAIVTLGFVVAKFSVWLHELGVELGSPQAATHRNASMLIGLAMMAFGGILSLLSAWRYHSVNRAIEAGALKADIKLVVLVAVAVAALSAAIMLDILLTSHAA